MTNKKYRAKVPSSYAERLRHVSSDGSVSLPTLIDQARHNDAPET